MAIRQDVPLSGLLIVILPIMGLVIGLVMSRAIPLFRAMQIKLDRINQVMRETLSGVRVIRAFVRTRHEEERFDVANIDLFNTAIAVNRLFAMTIPVMTGDPEPVARGGHVVRRDAGRQRTADADRQPDRVPPVPHADPVRGPDGRDHVRLRAPRGGLGRPDPGGARAWSPSVRDPEQPRHCRRRPARAGTVEFRDVEFRYPGAEAAGPARDHVRGPAGPDDRDRRQHRQRQDDPDQPHPAVLRRDRAARSWSTASTSATGPARTSVARSWA